jgi:hypothetical protein
MNGPIQATGAAETAGMAEVAQPEIHPGEHPGEGDPANDWLCAWCLNRVASEQDRFTYEGESEFSFKNPEGVRFRIITFQRAPGCRQTGKPTVEHTWFPGHAWSYCVCNRCGMHLGWYYDGLTHFAGLIRDRIVRAAVMFS